MHVPVAALQLVLQKLQLVVAGGVLLLFRIVPLDYRYVLLVAGLVSQFAAPPLLPPPELFQQALPLIYQLYVLQLGLIEPLPEFSHLLVDDLLLRQFLSDRLYLLFQYCVFLF